MHRRIKNVFRILYYFAISLLYEARQANPSPDRFDSRTIPPPRIKSLEERSLCEGGSSEFMGVPFTFSYRDVHVHSSIYWFKYKRDKYTTKLLGRILVDEILWMIYEKLDKRQSISDWIITFAPSTSFHRGDKKWDHNEDILKEVRGLLPFSFQKLFGLSEKIVSSNKKLTRSERLSSSEEKFIVLPNIETRENSGLIIFDDVTTTGSTLKNLEKLAANLKFKMILIIAIAH